MSESSEVAPAHWSGKRLLEGEQLALQALLPSACVVRFGGIYGPRRTSLIDSVRSGRASYRADPPQYTNRIHREDCAGVLRHLMGLENPESIYLAVDNEPAEERAVQLWLAWCWSRTAAPRCAATCGRTSQRRVRSTRRS